MIGYSDSNKDGGYLSSQWNLFAAQAGSVDRAIRLTEQGEMVAAKYVTPALARRNLETLLSATIESSCLDAEQLGAENDPDAADRFVQMYAEWPFFTAIVNNMGMVLAKANIDIGRRYAAVLVEDDATRNDIFGAIETEHTLTRRWHERITGSPDPLADNPLLARSLRNRYPYLDPLHVMQVDLLRRFRDGDDNELVQRGIQLTTNAIATGIRNSG